MGIFSKILYATIGISIFVILAWLFAVPNQLLVEQIEKTVTESGNNLNLSVNRLRKGIFFDISADSLDLMADNKPALVISSFSSSFTPRYLTSKQLAFDVNGKIGTGQISGIIKIPVEGKITVNRAELEAIPYISRFGIDAKGHLSSEVEINNNAIEIRFSVSDLNIDDTNSIIPLLNTFNRIQGALSMKDNMIKLKSISLEGEKGYARLKGSIKNGIMNLLLELMPDADKLTTVESLLIGKYIVSPGYYIVPIKGPLQ